MNISETLLEADYGFAVDGEAEMARLDDAGMHRTDRDLMQAFADGRQELIRCRNRARFDVSSKRVLHTKAVMIEPRPTVSKVKRLQPVEVLDRAFKANRGRMRLSDRRKLAVPAFDRHDDDLALLEQRHVHPTGIPPQTESRGAACREPRGSQPPRLRAHGHHRSGR